MALPPLEELLTPEQISRINDTLASSVEQAVTLLDEALRLGNDLEMEDRIKVAQDLLDRAGYSKKKQLEVKQEIDMALPDSVVMTALQGLSQMLGIGQGETLRDVTHEVPVVSSVVDSKSVVPDGTSVVSDSSSVEDNDKLVKESESKKKQADKTGKSASKGSSKAVSERKSKKGSQGPKKEKSLSEGLLQEDPDDEPFMGISEDVMNKMLGR